MTHDSPETKITGAESGGSPNKAEGGSTAAAEGAAGKNRLRRADKRTPAEAGEKQRNEASAKGAVKPNEVSGNPASGVAPGAPKLDQLVSLLRTPAGATLPELASATGWQVHSVRGAMAGALRKKGYTVVSEKPEGGVRRYRIGVAS
jgi:hypothetical protein